ncbi:hypothetical protein SAY86_022163 [Trapa natans]|uniref:1-phosphatidylinositol-4-phosphate 5-kinase n=1 Tax=Trapa natans TaxID=22666 RepID=A0AAN7RKV4_TRANT|nr:hypothetical protein SAY86_022163 [Trapa natans]
MAVDKREASPADFTYSERTVIRCSTPEFSFLSTETTAEFDWKDYSPAVFRHIQAMDNINYDDYMLSVCGHANLLGICSSPRPGTLHPVPHNDSFMICTLKKTEMKVLRGMLPNYYHHIKKFGASLLPKFYGLHLVRLHRGLKVYFVVVSNVLKSDQYIHFYYDLKGSLQGRRFNKLEIDQKTLLKDVDLDLRFYLEPLIQARLLAQIKHDCEFLEAEGIMDYSLVLGIHVETSYQGLANIQHSDAGTVSEDTENIELTMPDMCEPYTKPSFKIGVKLPARAIRTPKETISSRESVSVTQGMKMRSESYNVFLYFGIVDILKNYGMGKRIEHVYKSLQYNSKMISAVNPRVYSSRSQEFLGSIFREDETRELIILLQL